LPKALFAGKICRGFRTRPIRTIQINSDGCRARQWRTSHLVFRVDGKTGAMAPERRVMTATSVSWKSGSVVRLLSGGEAMRVVGRDSVGSVICQPLNDERHQGIYVPPSLLMAADPEPGAGTPGPSIPSAAEHA